MSDDRASEFERARVITGRQPGGCSLDDVVAHDRFVEDEMVDHEVDEVGIMLSASRLHSSDFSGTEWARFRGVRAADTVGAWRAN